MHYNFKKITVVPTSKDFVDIVLSKTQRKNPTVVHKSYDIGRLRSFYKRKIKFAQQTFHDKLASIISEFPKLDDVHPFYSDLMNILYDKDHYKLALGQVNQSMHLIDRVAKRNVTLLKHAASLFQCKRLKIASLGMMVKVVKKNAASFKYLEEVRQHLSRLPSIDPNTRTLLLCGFPNVGKSSFINKITRADVDVQPYAFTTKSLFVGHTDYHTLRYQVIDTPGLLDRQLEDRNTIEMQAITALAHLRAHVIFIMDPSEQCGFNMQAQLDLFNSMRPLFASKPKMVVLNKCDVREMGELDENYKSALAAIEDEGIKVFQMSTLKELGISEVKNHACSALLEFRVEAKMKMKKVTDVMNRLHVAMPKNYNPSARPPSIPENALKKKNSVVTQKKRTEKDISVEQGRDYHLDLNKNYLLKDQEWRYDVMPVFMDGHNVADFIDPEMDKKMEELEAEERMREEAGMYDDEEEEEDEEAKVVRKTAAKIRERKIIAIMESREKRRVKASTMPRTGVKMDTGTMVDKLATVGVEVDADDHETHLGRARSRSRQKAQTEKQSRKRHRDLSQSQSLARSQSRPPPRDKSGVRDEKMAAKAKKLVRIGQRERNRLGKVGESDRQIATKKPRHLYSGKRKMGKTDRR